MKNILPKVRHSTGRLLVCVAMTAVAASALAQTISPVSALASAPVNYDESWFAAARAGRTDLLSDMLAAGYPINATTIEGYTALTLTAYNHQQAALTLLLDHGANACLADKQGNTSLMGALFKGNNGIAEQLANTNCDIDQTNNAGETALSFAVMFGRLEMLPVLLNHGADLNHLDRQGHRPLDIAITQRNEAATQALRSLGAK